MAKREVIRDGKKNLAALIDEYGQMDEQEKKAKLAKAALKEEILLKLPKDRVKVWEGNEFTLAISESAKAVYDVLKVMDSFTKAKLGEFMSVTAGIKKYVVEADLEKYVLKYETSERFAPKRKK